MVLMVANLSNYDITVAFGTQTTLETVKSSQQDPGCCSSRDCSLEVDYDTGKHLDGETSITNATWMFPLKITLTWLACKGLMLKYDMLL